MTEGIHGGLPSGWFAMVVAVGVIKPPPGGPKVPAAVSARLTRLGYWRPCGIEQARAARGPAGRPHAPRGRLRLRRQSAARRRRRRLEPGRRSWTRARLVSASAGCHEVWLVDHA